MGDARYQKDLEKRVEALQAKLDAECDGRAAADKKYKKLFHQLMKDTHGIAGTLRYLERNIREAEDKGDGAPNILLDINEARDIVKEISAFHDKYSDKAYAFLKDIISKE
jgi:hypothetical protein